MIAEPGHCLGEGRLGVPARVTRWLSGRDGAEAVPSSTLTVAGSGSGSQEGARLLGIRWGPGTALHTERASGWLGGAGGREGDGQRGHCCAARGPQGAPAGETRSCWEPLGEALATFLTQEALLCSRLSFQATGGRMPPSHVPAGARLQSRRPVPQRLAVLFPGRRRKAKRTGWCPACGVVRGALVLLLRNGAP